MNLGGVQPSFIVLKFHPAVLQADLFVAFPDVQTVLDFLGEPRKVALNKGESYLPRIFQQK